MANTVRAENGAEVYTSKIKEYADEYIAHELNNPDDIYNTQCFDGMIDYIYTNVFRPRKGDKIYYNTRNSVLDTGDIDTLDDIFRQLKLLCGKYKKRITLLRFCTLIGIGNDVISQWISGETRAGVDGASSAHCQTAKKWKTECESALLSGAVDDNSVGCIFGLKANHGYTETPQRIEITGSNAPALSQDEIRQIVDQAKRESIPELLDSLPDD